MFVFLSYRRDDAGGWVRRLADALCRKFGRKNVFLDVDGIKDFDDFEANIFATIDRCDVFLAVIGQRWLELRDQQSGERRLDLPDDYVRLEIARALQRKIPVLPVLVDNAALPVPEQLPEDLGDLLRPRFHALTPERWNEDLAEFLRAIDTRPPLISRRALLAATLVFTAGALTGSLGSKVVGWVASLLSLDGVSPGCPYNGYGYDAAYGYRASIGGHLI
jgi:TIR domain